MILYYSYEILRKCLINTHIFQMHLTAIYYGMRPIIRNEQIKASIAP